VTLAVRFADERWSALGAGGRLATQPAHDG
jgi:hypothetical protein